VLRLSGSQLVVEPDESHLAGIVTVAQIRRRDVKVEERNRARCRRYGARHIEPVLLSVVFHRDRGECWLCGGQTLLNPPAGAITLGATGVPRPVPHPQLAALDHVVPLSERGDHSYANVLLAHQVCNGRCDRPSPEFLRELLQRVRSDWERNAATTARLAAVGYTAASLRSREGFGSSRIHLVTQLEEAWTLACPPRSSYSLERMQRTVDGPTCRPCRQLLRQ
jgi:hypothetical protein